MDPAPGARADRRLRVVHVITSLGAGGAEKQVEFLVRDSPHDVEVICLYESGIIGDRIVAAGTPVTVLGMGGWRKGLTVARLARLLRARRPDIVHVHLLSAQLWGIPAARLAGCPVIVSTEHSLMADTTEGRPLTAQLRLLCRLLASMATATVAVSEATAGRLRNLGVRPSRISVIENGIDIDALEFTLSGRDAVRAEIGIGTDTTVVGAVGRLAPVKRLDIIIRALREVLEVGSVELVIAGTGPLQEALLLQAAAQGSRAAVHLIGVRDDLAPLLSAFDLFISPSQDETFGMAVVEAAVNGLPLVYGECPALDELDAPLPGTVRLPRDVDSDIEDRTIRAAAAAADVSTTGRDCPPEIRTRFGLAVLRSSVDTLYERLTARTFPASLN